MKCKLSVIIFCDWKIDQENREQSMSEKSKIIFFHVVPFLKKEESNGVLSLYPFFHHCYELKKMKIIKTV